MGTKKGIFGVIASCFQIAIRASIPYTVIRLITRVVQATSVVVFSALSKRIVDYLLIASNSVERSKIFFYLGLIFMVKLIVLATDRWNEFCVNIHDDKIYHFVSMKINHAATSSDISQFDSVEFYNRLLFAQQGITSVQNLVWNAIDTLTFFISLAIAIVLLASYRIWMIIPIIATTAVSACVEQRNTNRFFLWNKDHLHQNREQQYYGTIQTSKNWSQEIRAFSLADYFAAKYDNLWKTLHRGKSKVLKENAISSGLVCIIPELISILFLTIVVVDISNGMITVGDFSYYSGVLGQIVSSTIILTKSVANIQNNKAYIEAVQSFVHQEGSQIKSGDKALKSIEKIEFQNVSFSYPGCSTKALDSVSFQIKKGSFACVVGENGSGKTTLLKLLLRFYDPTEGMILINGENVQEYTIDSVRRQMTYLTQMSPQYAFSLRDNIKLSDVGRQTNENEVESMLLEFQDPFFQKQDLDVFASKQFSKDGIELSQGQYQKLSFLRAVYRKCTCAVFDEFNATLDPISEKRVFDYISLNYSQMIVFYTTHRLNVIRPMDNILVMDKGRLVECGNRDSLLEKNGVYATLYRRQEKERSNY